MRSRRVMRGLAALTILTSFVAACGDDDDETTPVEETDDGTEQEAEAQEVDITAVDYSYPEAPTELDAGLVTVNFQNDGEVDHEIAFLEIGDTPLEEFLPKFVPVVSGEGGGPIPAEAQNVAAPIELGPGESVSTTFTINEGTYALLCTLTGDADAPEPVEGEEPEDGEEPEGNIHFNRGMAQVVTVNPGTADAALPEADGTITASDWTFDADLADGDTTFNFLNAGPNEVHFVGISLMPEGTDAATAEASFAAQFTAEEGSPPPEGTVEPENDEFGFGGVFSRGLGGRVELDEGFESGRTYVFYCFISDRAGGPPHAFPVEMGGHGMYKAFTIE